MPIEFRSIEFLKSTVREFNPRIATGKGTGMHDLVFVPNANIYDAYLFDLEGAFGDGSGMDQYDVISEERMDALAANLLIPRIEGSTGAQSARMLVDTLQDYTLGEGELLVEDEDGNLWENSALIDVPENTLTTQRDGIFYYFDAEFVSQEKEKELKKIVSIQESTIFAGYISVTGDESSIVDGVTRETNKELYLRINEAVAARDLTTNRGIKTVLPTNFPGTVTEIQPIGMGDPEMMRDILTDFNGNKINLHLGGYTDIHLKTPSLQEKEADILALEIDTDREQSRTSSRKLNGTTPVYIGRAPIVTVTSVTTSGGLLLDPADYVIDKTLGTIVSTTGSNESALIYYTYNPIAIDIARIPVAGREDHTITDLVFVNVISVEELDPATGEPIGNILTRNGGYGQAAYGMGGYGRGEDGDWEFKVDNPHNRYSMLEKSYIEFAPIHVGKDVRVTFHAVPAIESIHDFCRDGDERTNSADILPRLFVPMFISGAIEVETAKSNSSAPDADAVVALIEKFVRDYDGNNFELELVMKYLFDNGVYGMNKCFEWSGELHHMNGTVQVIKSKETISIPDVALPKDTDKPVSPRTVRFHPGTFNVTATVRTDK